MLNTKIYFLHLLLFQHSLSVFITYYLLFYMNKMADNIYFWTPVYIEEILN